LRADYADLFAEIGTAWGTADGTHFNLPDLRGRFPRGWADGQANDPDRASRTACNTGGQTGDKVGTVQAQGINYHTHTVVPYKDEQKPTVNGGISNKELWGSYSYFLGSAGGNETRPINAGVMFVIKY
jgi:microcystin-dependent protein